MFQAIETPAVFLGSRHSDSAPRRDFSHAHDYFELNFITSGKTKMKLNERVIHYDSFDFILIPPGMNHVLYWSEYDRFDNYVIWFRAHEELFDASYAIKLHDYDGSVQFLCAEIYRLSQSSGTEYADLLNAYLYAVLLHMRRGMLMNTATKSDKEDRIEEAVRFINVNILVQPVTVRIVAAEIGLSPAYFTRLFYQRLGIQPVKYISEVKIAQAKRMLRETAMPVSAISAALHYEDPLYFSRQFSKLTGMSPTQFRNANAPI